VLVIIINPEMLNYYEMTHCILHDHHSFPPHTTHTRQHVQSGDTYTHTHKF
jgi:hypothetical protein